MYVALILIPVLIASIVILFQILNWQTAKTYKPSKADVIEILDAVLSSRVTYIQWDEFICVPIRHDPELEKIRVCCAALDTNPSLLEEMGTEWPGNAGFNSLGLQRIREIRKSLSEEPIPPSSISI